MSGVRYALRPHEGQARNWCGTFERYGTAPRRADPYGRLLIVALAEPGGREFLTDHVWLVSTPALAALNPRPGDALLFRATCHAYVEQDGGALNYGLRDARDAVILPPGAPYHRMIARHRKRGTLPNCLTFALAAAR